jgi:hypothetical protein
VGIFTAQGENQELRAKLITTSRFHQNHGGFNLAFGDAPIFLEQPVFSWGPTSRKPYFSINATAAPHASPINISLEKRFITLLLAFNTNLPSQEERDFITIPTFPTL